MTANVTDRRVRRTKKLLLQGLAQLMQQKQVKDITVRELSDLVDINRGTFYLYYRDIFDMVEQVEKELLEKFDGIIEKIKDTNAADQKQSFLNEMFSFIMENKEMCKVLLGKNGDIVFLQRLKNIVHEKCRSNAMEFRYDIKGSEFDYRYGFVAFGIMGLIHCWLERDCEEPAEYMATLADQIIQSGNII